MKILLVLLTCIGLGVGGLYVYTISCENIVREKYKKTMSIINNECKTYKCANNEIKKFKEKTKFCIGR